VCVVYVQYVCTIKECPKSFVVFQCYTKRKFRQFLLDTAICAQYIGKYFFILTLSIYIYSWLKLDKKFNILTNWCWFAKLVKKFSSTKILYIKVTVCVCTPIGHWWLVWIRFTSWGREEDYIQVEGWSLLEGTKEWWLDIAGWSKQWPLYHPLYYSLYIIRWTWPRSRYLRDWMLVWIIEEKWGLWPHKLNF